jgi:cytochrome c oxidase subunit 3
MAPRFKNRATGRINMPMTLLPSLPASEPEIAPSDHSTSGIGGIPEGPRYDPQDNSSPEPATRAFDTYRLMTYVAIVWIITLFATLTAAVEWRWVHSPDWFAIPLPYALYVNAAILLGSSLTIQLARSSLRAGRHKRYTQCINATLLLGCAFTIGQLLAWLELSVRGLHLTSGAGSFFIYLLTGTYAVCLLGGDHRARIRGPFIHRWSEKTKQESALGIVALYWHFIDGLWLYLLALLLFTIQN